MSRPKSLSRIRTHELEEVYALVPGGGVDEAEVEYAPQIRWLRGNTIARQIRDGFYVHWASEVFDREVRLRGVEGHGFFVFTFALAGMWQDVVGARRKLFDRPGGTMAVLRCDHIVEHRALQTPGAMHLTIAIEREQLLKWFGEGELAQHPRLGRFLRGEGDGCLILPLTARARETVQQMQNCPFRGLTRSLAMEARCIDLLVEMIEQTERPQELPQAGKARFFGQNRAGADSRGGGASCRVSEPAACSRRAGPTLPLERIEAQSRVSSGLRHHGFWLPAPSAHAGGSAAAGDECLQHSGGLPPRGDQ